MIVTSFGLIGREASVTANKPGVHLPILHYRYLLTGNLLQFFDHEKTYFVELCVCFADVCPFVCPKKV